MDNIHFTILFHARISIFFVYFLQGIVIFAFLDYHSPIVGDYTFPSWADAIGWCLVSCSIMLIVTYGIYYLFRQNGTFLEVSYLLCTGHLWYSCQRPVFSLGVSQYKHKKNTLVPKMCVLSDAKKQGFSGSLYLSDKLPLSKKNEGAISHNVLYNSSPLLITVK